MNQKWEKPSQDPFDRFLIGLIGFKIEKDGPVKII